MRTRKTSWGRAAALIAALLVLGAGLTGCDTGGGGGGTGLVTGDTTEYVKAVYTLQSGEVLTISGNEADVRAAITHTSPQAGDFYVLKSGSTIISKGKITNKTGDDFTFTGTSGATAVKTIKIAISSNTLTVKTKITYRVNETEKEIADGTFGGSGSGSPTEFEGSWKGWNGDHSTRQTFMFTGDAVFVIFTNPNNNVVVGSIKGTFTYTSNTITFTLTARKENANDAWVTEWDDNNGQHIVTPVIQTGNYVLSANELTFTDGTDSVSFIKQ